WKHGYYSREAKADGRACGRQYLRSAICATRSKAPAVPRSTTPDHLSGRTDCHRCQWQGREDIAELAIGHVRADLIARYNKDEAWSGRSDAFERVSAHIATAIGGAAQFC